VIPLFEISQSQVERLQQQRDVAFADRVIDFLYQNLPAARSYERTQLADALDSIAPRAKAFELSSERALATLLAASIVEQNNIFDDPKARSVLEDTNYAPTERVAFIAQQYL